MFQKLPFTIPELVQASPCRSSDGILYTGERLILIHSFVIINLKFHSPNFTITMAYGEGRDSNKPITINNEHCFST